MHSTLLALTWEYERKNRWWTIGLMLALACIAALLFALMHKNEANQLEYVLPAALLAIEFIGIGYFMLWAQYDSQTQRLGFDRHHYAQPISTFKLVTWELLLRLVTASLLHVWTLLILHITETVSFAAQLGVPNLLLMVVWLNASAWMFPDSRWLQRPLTILTFLFMSLSPHWLDAIMARTGISPKALLIYSIYSKAATLLIGFGLAWWAITLDRRGSSFSLQQWVSWRLNRLTITRPYRSPLQAQFWFEFKRKCWAGVIINVVSFILLWTLYGSGLISSMTLANFIFLLAIVNTMVYPVIIAIQLSQHGGNSFLIESYKATKPITTTALLRCYLLVALASLALMWVVYLIGVSGTGTMLFFTGELDRTQSLWGDFGLAGQYKPFLTISQALLASWTIFGISATVMLAGRKWLAIVFWLGIWLVPLALSLIANFSPSMIRELVWGGAVILVVVLGLMGTWLAYIVAWKKKLLHPILNLVAIGLFILICMFQVDFKQSALLQMTWWALPFTPLATAPLALAWNRHR